VSANRGKHLVPTTKSARLRLRPPKPPLVEPPEPDRPFWKIPLGWLRDESFYRDIATEILAVGVVALIAYTYAVSAGYVSTPSGKAALVTVLLVFSVVMVVLTYTAAYRGNMLRSFLLLVVGCAPYIAAIILANQIRPGFAEEVLIEAPKRYWWVFLFSVPIALLVLGRGFRVWYRRRRKAREALKLHASAGPAVPSAGAPGHSARDSRNVVRVPDQGAGVGVIDQ
jgi:hypothetical protein